jgi:hypothetical protein
VIYLAIIAFLAFLALIGCAIGTFWGPGILGLAFLFPALMLLAAENTQATLLGLLSLGASIVELGAAYEYWKRRHTVAGPSRSWRVLATLVGLAGSALLVFTVYAMIVLLAWIASLS